MERFEMIRRGHAVGETIRQLAKKHNVHRRMVRQALERTRFRRTVRNPSGSSRSWVR
jgi:hypothetical protein